MAIALIKRDVPHPEIAGAATRVGGRRRRDAAAAQADSRPIATGRRTGMRRSLASSVGIGAPDSVDLDGRALLTATAKTAPQSACTSSRVR
jgi:hypothetical protein